MGTLGESEVDWVTHLLRTGIPIDLFDWLRKETSDIEIAPIEACIANVRGRPTGARFLRPPVGRPGALAMQTPIVSQTGSPAG